MSASSEFPKDRPNYFVRPFVGGQPMGRPGPLRKATNRRPTAAPFTAVSTAPHAQPEDGALATASEPLNEGAEAEAPELAIGQESPDSINDSFSDQPTPPSALQIQDFTDQPWHKAAEAAAVVFPDVSLVDDRASDDVEPEPQAGADEVGLEQAEMHVDAVLQEAEANVVSADTWGSVPEAIVETEASVSDENRGTEGGDVVGSGELMAAEVDFSWGDESAQARGENPHTLFDASASEVIAADSVENTDSALPAESTQSFSAEVKNSGGASEEAQDAVHAQAAEHELSEEVSAAPTGEVRSLLAPLPASREDLELGWLDEDTDHSVASDAADIEAVDAFSGTPIAADVISSNRLVAAPNELEGEDLAGSLSDDRQGSETSPSTIAATPDLVVDDIEEEVGSELPPESSFAESVAREGEEAASADFPDAGYTLSEVDVEAAPRASQLPEWAMGGLGASPTMEADADLAAFVAEGELVDRGVKVLEGVARQVRSGEIVLPPGSGATVESVLAAVLAQLLTRAD